MDAASPSASSTFSLAAAVVCSCASVVAALAIHRLQSQHVLAAQAGNGPGNVCLAARALAELTGDVGREPGVGRTCHQLQCLRDFVLGKHIQERRLVQRNVECGLERVVEDRIARAVGKVGENDGVFVGESVLSVLA